MRTTGGTSREENLRAELARADAMAGTVQPLLRHLLGSEGGALFSDDVLARVRGMVSHVARQLREAASEAEPSAVLSVEALERALLESDALLPHLHGAAIEWQVAERLERHLGIDPVMPPLMQALIVAPSSQTQADAMRLLAAQARWTQAQRRMELALGDLPGEQLHAALCTLRFNGAGGEHHLSSADARLRADYDEGASRLGLAARVIASMGDDAGRALDLEHAGLCLFVTAVAFGSEQGRDAVLLSLHESQGVRFALALRACGLAFSQIERQVYALRPAAEVPLGLDAIAPERAAEMLARRDVR